MLPALGAGVLLAPRYIPRLAATVSLFTRHGLRDLAHQQGLLELAPEAAASPADGGRELAARAAEFRRGLVALGPAYVKLGQVLSTRPDLLPPAYIAELEHLQDDLEPVPAEEIEAIVEAELGARLSRLFADFDREPLGAASLGQAHPARMRDGRAVVVKVQRPGVRERIAEDVEFFRELARFLASHTRAGARMDFVGVIQQLERALADELDYRLEARNAAVLRRSLAEFPRILIPRVVEAYSTERVLTSERIRGVKITAVPPVARVEHELGPLADEFARAYLKQIVVDGHFHADPHPGNVFLVLPGAPNPQTPAEAAAAVERREVERPLASDLGRIEREARRDAPLPAALEEPRLALVDFGMTARLPGALRDSVVRLLVAIADDQGDAAAEVLIELGQPLEGFDRGAYVSEIASLLARTHDLSVGDVRAGQLLFEVIDLSYRYGVRLPPQLALLAKALFNLDAVTRALDPGYSPIEAIRSFSVRVADERARRELTPHRILQRAAETADLLAVLPRRIDQITRRLAANEMGVRVDAPQLGVLLDGLQKVANRIFTGLVLGGLLVASAMLLPHTRALGVAGFVVAAVLAVYMVGSILVTDRRERDGP